MLAQFYLKPADYVSGSFMAYLDIILLFVIAIGLGPPGGRMLVFCTSVIRFYHL